VDGTVEVTFDSFDDIIDLLGGVDLDNGHLTAAEAEEAVHNRFVQQDGDFGRADVQREILKSLLPKLTSSTNVRKVYDYLLTSDRARLTISKPSLLAFGIAYVIGHKGNVTLGDINEVVLPGIGTRIYTPSFGKSLYYWELDTVGTDEVITNYLK
jgi:anionic cell wall polymer biosynthesis LytR-Cps2A-Psr (LCP) family protein